MYSRFSDYSVNLDRHVTIDDKLMLIQGNFLVLK